MRIFTFSIITFLAFFTAINVNAQTIVNDGFESWTDINHPLMWCGSKTNFNPATNIVQYSTSVHGGTYAVQLINTLTSGQRFTTQGVSVTAGTTYTISFWVRGHGGIATRIWDGAYEGSVTYSNINSSTWTQMSKQVSAVNSVSNAEFIFYVNNSNVDLGHIQLDDVTINGPNGASPLISITSPSYNEVIYTPDVNINFVVSNFVVGASDGHIKPTVDGVVGVIASDLNPISITGLAAGQHTIILELVDNTNASLNPIAVDTVKITTNLTPPVAKSIYEIQYTTAVPAISPYVDVLVTTSGIVTGKCGTGFFMQDSAKAWNGIFVLTNTSAYPTLNVGDSITVSGLVNEYYDFTEIKSLSSLTINSSEHAGPTSSTVNSTTVKQEQYESVLVNITNAKCINANAGYGMWTVKDGINAGDTCKIHDLLFAASPLLNTVYSITGPVYYDFSEFKIEPRSAADVTTGLNEIYTLEANIYPNPAINFITISAKENISLVQIFDIQGRIVIEYNFNGTSEIKLNVCDLPKGLYNIVALSTKGNSFSTKLIK